MKDILTELYFLFSEQEYYPDGSPASELQGRIIAMEKPLCEIFGVKYMNALADVQAELSDIYQKDSFFHGFFCGVELMKAIQNFECFTGNG